MVVLGAVLGSVLVSSAAGYVRLNGINYVWPTGHAAKALANNGSATLTWTGDIDSGVPAGLIGFWDGGSSCPSGWAEYTAARNHYIVNSSSAYMGWDVGVAIDANGGENRVTSTHGHTASLSATVSDSAHDHSDSASNHNHGNIIGYAASTSLTGVGGAWTGANSNTAGSDLDTSTGYANSNVWASPSLSITGISGGVSGTNAPYIRLLVCQKQ
jgi:hypothetical protein